MNRQEARWARKAGPVTTRRIGEEPRSAILLTVAERSFPTLSQKREYRRRLTRATGEADEMNAEYVTAIEAGLRYPRDWSEAKCRRYDMGPVRVADELQAKADAEREDARLGDLELVEAAIVVDEKWFADHPDPPPASGHAGACPSTFEVATCDRCMWLSMKDSLQDSRNEKYRLRNTSYL
jgi:hypothetical protein